MRLGLVALFILGSCYGRCAFAADQPQAIGEAFCKARLANDEQATLALLAPSLVEAISEAKARSEVIGKATPNEKPPFGDGIPFQAFPDVAQGCEAGGVHEGAGRFEVEVNYLFADSPNANWTDRLKLVADGERLLIDDVIYVNVANGEPDLGLRRVLFEAFDQ